MRVSFRNALATQRANPKSVWHTGDSDEVTTKPEHAAARIFERYSTIAAVYRGPRLKPEDPVFAMGSCFAREIESALLKRGGNVTSRDRVLIRRREFRDNQGRFREGFFHRYTPRAILHEFLIAFDALESWKADSSLLFRGMLKTRDLNYCVVEGADQGFDAALVRRHIARDLVKRAAEAKLIILTLGLTEGWVETPTGFHLNRFDPAVARNNDNFAFERQDYGNVLDCLEEIHALLTRHHKTGDFQLVLTVSPVPMYTTFTDQDIVVANMDSKATLRTAAAAFVGRHANVHYFPSYEQVLYSSVKAAWRPDRLHVNKGMVDQIVAQFVTAYYEPGTMVRLAPSSEPQTEAPTGLLSRLRSGVRGRTHGRAGRDA